MKNAQKPDHRSLNVMLGWLRDGRYVVPDFQREFEWMAWDVRDLVKSIFLDYYIGSLLLWKGKKSNFSGLSCEPIYGFTGNGHPEYIVLDGQQRLTAMYYAFVAPGIKFPNHASRAIYSIKIDQFMSERYDEAFVYQWDSKSLQAKFSDQDALFADHIFPCSVIGAGGFELGNWVQSYTKFWGDRAHSAEFEGDSELAVEAKRHADNAKAFGDHLRGIVEEYQISFIELDEDLEIDKVCDIFTQLNSKGVRLDAFDLMNALLKPKHLQLKHMWR